MNSTLKYLLCAGLLFGSLHATEETDVDQVELNEERVDNGAMYTTSHIGAYQNFITIDHETIELTDASVWSIKASDCYKTKEWLNTDILAITVNYSLFNSYDFRINNLNTGTSIRVNLSLEPKPSYICTHWIMGIDPDSSQILLEDGSIWDVSVSDGALNHWFEGQTVIIGINDSFFASHPNILIHTKSRVYVTAKKLRI